MKTYHAPTNAEIEAYRKAMSDRIEAVSTNRSRRMRCKGEPLLPLPTLLPRLKLPVAYYTDGTYGGTCYTDEQVAEALKAGMRIKMEAMGLL